MIETQRSHTRKTIIIKNNSPRKQLKTKRKYTKQTIQKLDIFTFKLKLKLKLEPISMLKIIMSISPWG